MFPVPRSLTTVPSWSIVLNDPFRTKKMGTKKLTVSRKNPYLQWFCHLHPTTSFRAKSPEAVSSQIPLVIRSLDIGPCLNFPTYVHPKPPRGKMKV
jgi:hypothetical protein